MKQTGVLTKLLAIGGTVLVALPIVVPIALSVLVLVADGILRFDFLMPAELFLVALIGGALLLWASWRAGSRRGLIGWGLAAMVGLLIASQGLAILTGLASGETEPAGWPLVLVVASLAGYTLALVEVGIAGALLVRDLFRQEEHDGSNPLAVDHGSPDGHL